MTEPEQIFRTIVKQSPNAELGNMFGAKSLKASNGKTAAFFLNDNMTFKLDDKALQMALGLAGAKAGTHIYNSKKQMTGWVQITPKNMSKWPSLADDAIEYVLGL